MSMLKCIFLEQDNENLVMLLLYWLRISTTNIFIQIRISLRIEIYNKKSLSVHGIYVKCLNLILCCSLYDLLKMKLEESAEGHAACY